MKRITEYPYAYELSGETWDLHENMLRRILANGRELKLSLDGKIIGAEVSEELDDMAIAVLYEPEMETYFITKRYGWLGPFTDVEKVEFDRNEKAAVVTAQKDGKAGKYALKR